MKSRVLMVTAALLLKAAAAQSQAFTEAFDNISTLPASGWLQINHSSPLGGTDWFQGNPAVFVSQAGAPEAYIAANFNNTGDNGTISNWLLTPPAMLVNGATLTFWTRTTTPGTTVFADRLQVRASTAGNGGDVGTTATDVGTFTILLLDINPNYTATGYPIVWQQFTATVSGVPSATLGRLAFRYFVEDAGFFGNNSDYIGIDTVVFTPGVAAATVIPVSLAVDAAGNGVIEPNEPAVVLAPSWQNTTAVAIASLTGALTNFTGPAGPTYTINDPAADYGTVAANATASCGANCYAVTATASTRPSLHWDASALETVSTGPATKTWALHVGASFTDVPPTNGFYRFIETILHKNVTGGCSATAYCPTADTTRDQMAVFVLVSKEPAGYVPAACGATPMFTDVPVSSGFCRWVEELARRSVVGGCAPNLYCPTAPATREQMAVFVLRTLDPALSPPACGATPMFSDVPASNGFCRWIEELARRGVVTGCGGGNYCPSAPVTREQMGVFLAATFSLTLYGL